ncbi:uncharacterized protein LOC144161805 [Haemaphysalis longicornis]
MKKLAGHTQAQYLDVPSLCTTSCIWPDRSSSCCQAHNTTWHWICCAGVVILATTEKGRHEKVDKTSNRLATGSLTSALATCSHDLLATFCTQIQKTPISWMPGPPGGLGAGRACCLFRAKVLRLESPMCGRVGSGAAQVLALGEGFSLLGPEDSAGSPYMPGNGEGSLVLSIVGVRLGLRYAKALHARLGAWSSHQQPPGMLQRRLPAGPLSAFSTLSRRRIDVAFTCSHDRPMEPQFPSPYANSHLVHLPYRGNATS